MTVFKIHFLPKTFALVLAVAVCILNCEGETGAQEQQTEETAGAPLSVPAFDRDSAYNFIAKQVSFGPRVLGSEGHEQCKSWLVEKFKSYGATVIEQDFDAEVYTGEKFPATNIIAQYNLNARKRILLAAHWDTRHIADSPLSEERRDEPILGADDGGSGVGVLLEIARLLNSNPIGMGVDIILFDAEDYGDSENNTVEADKSWALGSQYWSANMHKSGYRAQYGILLDMVGADDARFPKEQYSVQFAGPLVDKVWDLANRMGYGNYFVNVNGGGVNDDHIPVNTVARIPMIDIINLPAESRNNSFGEHWHTHNDNLDVINKRTLGAVGQVVTAVIYREAGGNL